MVRGAGRGPSMQRAGGDPSRWRTLVQAGYTPASGRTKALGLPRGPWMKQAEEGMGAAEVWGQWGLGDPMGQDQVCGFCPRCCGSHWGVQQASDRLWDGFTSISPAAGWGLAAGGSEAGRWGHQNCRAAVAEAVVLHPGEGQQSSSGAGLSSRPGAQSAATP